MKTIQQNLIFNTPGRGTFEITHQIEQIIAKQNITTGLCHLFIKHTSASLMICENADPQVCADVETFLADLAPDGDPRFLHHDEGPDDMAAHLRTIVTRTDLTIPIVQGKLGLGTWQGIFVYEHRANGHQRTVIVTLI
jgi:secondary thiamine-phosphate synthase enzyme